MVLAKCSSVLSEVQVQVVLDRLEDSADELGTRLESLVSSKVVSANLEGPSRHSVLVSKESWKGSRRRPSQSLVSL